MMYTKSRDGHCHCTQLPVRLVLSLLVWIGTAGSHGVECMRGGPGPLKANTSDTMTLEWVPATATEWRDLLRRRGCGKSRATEAGRAGAGFLRYAVCCSRMQPPPSVEVTPVRHLVLKTTDGRKPPSVMGIGVIAYLDRVLGGGVLTFVGDSVTSQAYYSILTLARTSTHYAVRRPVVPISPLATAAVSLERRASGRSKARHAFTLEVFRTDRASEFERMVNRALTIAPVRYPRNASKLSPAVPHPRHVVAVNVGLHFSSKSAAAFESEIRSLATRMQLLNHLTGHFAFFRDVTPQHFKPRRGGLPDAVFGGFEKRDRSATRCVPHGSFSNTTRTPASAWPPPQPRDGEGVDFNGILRSVAAEIGVPVQSTQPLLRSRHDAHIEARKSRPDLLSLDCTHWCAAVLDVFDITLVDVLQARYGKDGLCL